MSNKTNGVAGGKPPSRPHTFKIQLHQLLALKKIEQRTGANVSEQIRRGIDLWLDKQGAGR